MKHKIFRSTDSNVSKFVFEKEAKNGNKPIAVEAVLYKYPTYKERTVICCSVQSGCPVGCTFCGTGMFFQRNLTCFEIVEQVKTVLGYIDCDPSEIQKFQIMFMSMGEPFMNFEETETAIRMLHTIYPNASLLISTSAPYPHTINRMQDLITLSKDIDKVGLQFSVHESDDQNRKRLIPTKTCTLDQIGTLGERWAKAVDRKPFFNYCVHSGNSSDDDVARLKKNFNPDVWECTLSVICEKDQSMSSAIENQLEVINGFAKSMRDVGYSVRVFNPAGQDDIGGGCGQLWYFQEWLNNNRKGKHGNSKG